MKVYKIDKAGRKIEYWYDKAARTWFAAEIDSFGNLGPTIDSFRKSDIIAGILMGFVPRVDHENGRRNRRGAE